ncbi:MAG: response regulator [Bacteroidia bacterium]|nr:response regulator [Bacteroidia bacterium]
MNPRRKVVLIEDDKNFSEVLTNILEYSGYQVKTAHGGVEGFELIHAFNPEVVLCDLHMPGLNGMDVLNQLRNSEQKVTPFIFISGDSDYRNIRKGMNQGADDFLTKPILMQDLLESIESRIQRRKEFDSAAELDEQTDFDFQQETEYEEKESWSAEEHGILEISSRINRYLVDVESNNQSEIRANILSTAGKAVIQTLNHSGRLGDLQMDLDPGILAANEELLARAISEMLKNCLEYSESGTPIVIKGISEARYYKLLICDEGKRLSDLELKNIRNYKPFGKGSKYKPGLGIALASKIMRTFNGSLNFDKNEPFGLKAILLCPKTKNNT